MFRRTRGDREPVTHRKDSDIMPSYLFDSHRRSHVDQSRICEDRSMMQKGQLLILFGHQ